MSRDSWLSCDESASDAESLGRRARRQSSTTNDDDDDDDDDDGGDDEEGVRAWTMRASRRVSRAPARDASWWWW